MQPFDLLQWAVRALSFFNTIAFLWLGMAVLLNAQRRAPGTWATGGGLILAGLFFAVHSTLVGREIGTFDAEIAFWWRYLWLMFVVPPYGWYVVISWYSGVLGAGPHRGLVSLTTLLAVGLLAVAASAVLLPAYEQLTTRAGVELATSGLVPVAILAYPAYGALCFALSLLALRQPGISKRFMGDLGRQRARPWLVAASLVLLGVSLLVGTAVVWLIDGVWSGRLALLSPDTVASLMRIDLAVSVLLAAVVVLLGRAIVSYEIFTGKVLPRGGLLRHWRNSLVLAGGYGLLMGGSLGLPIDSIYRLMLATLLIAAFYALLSWRSYLERERGIEGLRPFVASQRLYEQLLKPSDPLEVDVKEPFRALCEEVLEAKAAYLIALGPLAPLVEAPLTYPPGAVLPVETLPPLGDRFSGPGAMAVPLDPAHSGGAVWAVPLWSERGLIGALLLGEKRGGGLYVQEEIEVARAAGERLADIQASAEMARRLMAAQRQRLAETQLLDRRARRVLHDDVLPQLHAALLALSSQGDGGQASGNRQQATEDEDRGRNHEGTKDTKNHEERDRGIGVGGWELGDGGRAPGERAESCELAADSYPGEAPAEPPFVTPNRVASELVSDGSRDETPDPASLCDGSRDGMPCRTEVSLNHVGRGALPRHPGHTDSNPIPLAPDPRAEVVQTLADVHRRISDLLREMPAAVAPGLARFGLVGALRQVVEGDLAGAFDQVSWEIDPEAEAAARAFSPLGAPLEARGGWHLGVGTHIGEALPVPVGTGGPRRIQHHQHRVLVYQARLDERLPGRVADAVGEVHRHSPASRGHVPGVKSGDPGGVVAVLLRRERQSGNGGKTPYHPVSVGVQVDVRGPGGAPFPHSCPLRIYLRHQGRHPHPVAASIRVHRLHFRREVPGRCHSIPFPREPRIVSSGLDAVGAVDPGSGPVGKGRPVVGLAPRHQSRGGLLERVPVGSVVLVLERLPGDIRDLTGQHTEPQLELGLGLRARDSAPAETDRAENGADRYQDSTPHASSPPETGVLGVPISAGWTSDVSPRSQRSRQSRVRIRRRIRGRFRAGASASPAYERPERHPPPGSRRAPPS